jgi:hypothetical protein
MMDKIQSSAAGIRNQRLQFSMLFAPLQCHLQTTFDQLN